MSLFFPDLLEDFLSPDFLVNVCRKFHYGEEQITELRAVAEEMLPWMHREAFWERRKSGVMDGQQAGAANGTYEDVVMSLGSGLDRLQEGYQEKGLLSESYMLEALASGLLLAGYGAYNRYVEENRDCHVARYHFPGGEEGFPLEMVSVLLKGFSGPVVCNGAFCMIPKKSVVFVAELTQDMQIRCGGICAGCHNVQCPNRVEEDPLRGRILARMADMPMNYGYSRIFGRPY